MAMPATDTRVRSLGLACAASGVLMALLSPVGLWRDDAVPATQWSYPQSPSVFLVFSALLVLAHVMSACGFWAVHQAGVTTSRSGRAGLVVAAVALVALSGCELVSGLLGGYDTGTAAVGLVSTLFGVASMLFAAGAVVAGTSLIRNGRRALGWLVLLTGLVIVVLVTPANISGSLVFRQLSLLVWSALFVPLGLHVARLKPRSDSEPSLAVAGRAGRRLTPLD